jgi:hypothetical protein
VGECGGDEVNEDTNIINGFLFGAFITLFFFWVTNPMRWRK